MDARLLRLAIVVAAFGSLGASYRTNNFIVTAPSAEMAQQIGKAAETYRRDLAIEWLGQAMPNWSQPCVMTVQVGRPPGRRRRDHVRLRPRRGLRLADDDPGFA